MSSPEDSLPPTGRCEQLLLTAAAWLEIGRMPAEEFERLHSALDRLRPTLVVGNNSLSLDGYRIEVVVQDDGQGFVTRIRAEVS